MDGWMDGWMDGCGGVGMIVVGLIPVAGAVSTMHEVAAHQRMAGGAQSVCITQVIGFHSTFKLSYFPTM